MSKLGVTIKKNARKLTEKVIKLKFATDVIPSVQ